MYLRTLFFMIPFVMTTPLHVTNQPTLEQTTQLDNPKHSQQSVTSVTYEEALISQATSSSSVDAKLQTVDVAVKETAEEGPKLKKGDHVEIPILMYHLCMDKIPEGLGGMAVTPKRLEEHIKALLQAGYTPIHFKEYYDFITYGEPLPLKPIILTFDDGYENNYTEAFPILKKYEVKATIFINPYTVDNEMGEYSHLDWEQMKEMEESGLVSIQSHGYKHENINSLSNEKLEASVKKGFERIEDELGQREIYVFSYPGYSYNERTVEKLNQMGIHMQVTKLGEKVSNKTPLSHITRQRASQGQSGKSLIQAIQ